LLAITLLAAFLSFYRLEQEGWGNLYYAATVKSMLSSWHNFFFASFDPGGFVSVDKPPLGFWVQALSATLFGFSGWSLILPQALAGVLAVPLLYHLVQRVFGVPAGLLAALVLAITPISVAAHRNNTMDSQLVLTSLLAAWAISLAVEKGKLRWLLACVVLVGIGFNIKMLQAFLVLPAFYLVYLVAPLAWWKRLLHLGLATLVLAAVSLAWPVAVDLTPPDQRPYVGSSQDNSVLELVIGHNGLRRLLPGGPARPPANVQQPVQSSSPGPSVPGTPGGGTPFSQETGSPGLLRLYTEQLAGQTSWLLPLAAIGLWLPPGRCLHWPLELAIRPCCCGPAGWSHNCSFQLCQPFTAITWKCSRRPSPPWWAPGWSRCGRITASLAMRPAPGPGKAGCCPPLCC
jgi:4-amino-4-deoxy-L-arabinose transferase-like glycosyltransferase